MEKQFATLVVLEEGNKDFAYGPESGCCSTSLGMLM
jgi:hypothetical protein